MTMKTKQFSFLCGAILQGLVLGFGLLLAFTKLASTELGSRLFRYQGF
jgi:hypothetical protein